MPEAQFEIFADTRKEFRFRLKAPNGEIIAQSQGYASRTGALEGIASVRHNAPLAKQVDLTKGDEGVAGGPKFEVFKDAQGEFRFRLKAPNGEIIAQSQGYDAKVSCIDGTYSVMHNAPRAKVVDLSTQRTAARVRHSKGWVLMCRLVQSYIFRGMWWRDLLTGHPRRRFPRRCE